MLKLPFRILPASWGLIGNAYLEAKAHYELEGETLARRLLEIRAVDMKEIQRKSLDIDLQYNRMPLYDYRKHVATLELNGKELEIRLLDIELEFGKISSYDANHRKIEITYMPGQERDLALLAVEYEANNITKNAYEKSCATIRNEPWIAIIDSGFDPEQGIDGVFFEFDWNAQWIEFLRLNGYIGRTDEQIVDDWFSNVCRSYTNADYSSTPFPNNFG